MAGTPDAEWSRRPASRPRLRFLTRLTGPPLRLKAAMRECLPPRLRACTRQQNRTGPPQLQYTTSRALVGRQARRQWSRRLAPQSRVPLALAGKFPAALNPGLAAGRGAPCVPAHCPPPDSALTGRLVTARRGGLPTMRINDARNIHARLFGMQVPGRGARQGGRVVKRGEEVALQQADARARVSNGARRRKAGPFDFF